MHQDEEQKLRPLKWYRALDSHKARRAAGAFLVEGERAMGQLLQGHRNSIMEILALPGMAARFPGLTLRILTPAQFASISTEKTPQGLAALVRLPADTYSDKLPELPGRHILLLEHIQDPGNTGTLIRTASAFDYDGVIMSDKCADPFSPKAVQSSAGSILAPWIRRSPRYLQMAEELQQKGYKLIAAALDGGGDMQHLRAAKTVLALGNEAAGLGGEILSMADYRVGIPINRQKAESLNAASCGAILMYLSTAR
jgi:TrmH family RNA methyltransferase